METKGAGVPTVELVGVSRVYEQGRIPALRGVSLRVEPGERVAVLGPSGSGKSTLLHLMSGLDAPTGGRVLFQGAEPDSAARWARLRARRIGIVFQAFHLLPALTALENVQIPMIGVVRGAGARRDRAAALLERVGLEGRLGHRPARLSGGERQRVAIARALANRPRLLLADEPTGNLDTSTSERIRELLEAIHRQEGISMVVVTHEAAFARLGTRTVHLVDGRIVSGPTGGA